MKHNKYKELNSDGKELRTVSITDELAQRLNKQVKDTGLSYKQDKSFEKKDDKKSDKNDAKTVKVGENEYDKALVIDALAVLEVTLNKNTGVKKTQEAVNKLTDELLEKLQEELTKE